MKLQKSYTGYQTKHAESYGVLKDLVALMSIMLMAYIALLFAAPWSY